jgi:hypothetical protein
MQNDAKEFNKTRDDKVMRSFDTGATRDTAEGKLDMEGFTHPMVMKQFAKYMNMNRLQSDGIPRASDNWQKGIPMEAYMKSLRRHHDDAWLFHRGFKDELDSGSIIAALCGIIFNANGYLLEYLKSIDFLLQDFDGVEPTPEMEKRQAKVSGNYFDEETSTLHINMDADAEPGINASLGWPGEPYDDVVEIPQVTVQEEDLVEVPEVPVCFGNCSGPCIECKDSAECDSTDCLECEFSDECNEDFMAGGQGREPFDDTAPEEHGPEKCSGCLSFKKTWDEWPCSECLVNPFTDDPTRKLFYCPPL